MDLLGEPPHLIRGQAGLVRELRDPLGFNSLELHASAREGILQTLDLVGRNSGFLREGCHVLLRFASLLHRLRSEKHTSELQSRENLVCRLLLEKKKHTAGAEYV